MTSATSRSKLLDELSLLLDLERSRRFHAGEVALDTSRMEALLAALGERPRPAISVHVAGSEGKTSVSELIAAGLRAHGLATAAYTSPHLRDVRERVRIDDVFPTDALLDHAAIRVREAADSAKVEPSWFEFMTGVARVVFAEAGVPAVVWETGLGGRLDATRCLPADVCVITTISLEHTAILGADLPTIAGEKAGILRPGAPVVIGGGVPAVAREVIEQRARELDCPVRVAPEHADDFDRENRALAAAVLDVLAERGRLPARTAGVDAALEAHEVGGRWHRAGELLFDGAHTVAACEALARRLASEQVGCLVFGATSGRDTAAMLRALLPVCPAVLLTTTPGERGVEASTMKSDDPDLAGLEVVSDPREALAEARRRAGADRLVVVAGSLHLVGHLLGADAR
ncbi:MAG: bifunctional folylpolyglutamate synthase/dihydrofolate synthase [Planctomycetota bacterium]|jgi:dihydrofolate synthase/folylpolyglutamate synthase